MRHFIFATPELRAFDRNATDCQPVVGGSLSGSEGHLSAGSASAKLTSLQLRLVGQMLLPENRGRRFSRTNADLNFKAAFK